MTLSRMALKLCNAKCLFMMNVVYAECHYAQCCYAECHYVQCCYAKCSYAECRYAECHGTTVGPFSAYLFGS